MENRQKWTFLWVILGLILLPGTTSAQSYSNFSSLVTTVLTGYDVDVLPRSDHSKPLTIDLSGYLFSLLEVDVVLGQITVLFSLSAQWMDSQITWTPSDHDGISYIVLPQKRVWTPTFVLSTPMDFSAQGETWMPVTIKSNGSASIGLGDVVYSRCTFNMKFWPFDKHTCDIVFEAYGYTSADIVLTTTSMENFHTSTFQNDNIEWKVTGSSVFIREHYGITDIVFQIEIERLSGIFIILIVFPLYGLAFLSSFVFILPSEAGERVGMSTTLMLAMTVFLEVISDYIPNTSKPIPLLCVIVTLGIAMSIMCTLMVILSFYFYNKDDASPVYGYFVTFVRFFNKPFRHSKVDTDTDNACFDKRLNNSKIASAFEGTNDSFGERLRHHKLAADCITVTDADTSYNRPNNDNTSSTESNRDGVTSDDKKGNVVDIGMELRWKDVSYTIDRVCFAMSSVIHCVMIIIFTFYLTIGSTNE